MLRVVLVGSVVAAAWNPVRFAQQAWFFNQPLTRALEPLDGNVRLYPRRGVEWGPLDDVVMGGESSSTWENGVWRGRVTTANNGGFAGVRTRPLRPAIDASRYAGIRIRVTSDRESRFKFITRDNEEWNGIAWTWIFDAPAGRRVEISLPFAEAVPTKFARSLPDVPPLDTSHLVTLQLALSKFEFDDALNPRFQEGDFQLTLDSIELYTA